MVSHIVGERKVADVIFTDFSEALHCPSWHLSGQTVQLVDKQVQAMLGDELAQQ